MLFFNSTHLLIIERKLSFLFHQVYLPIPLFYINVYILFLFITIYDFASFLFCCPHFIIINYFLFFFGFPLIVLILLPFLASHYLLVHLIYLQPIFYFIFLSYFLHLQLLFLLLLLLLHCQLHLLHLISLGFNASIFAFRTDYIPNASLKLFKVISL